MNTEITNQYEQIEMAAEAAGYLGMLDVETGERQWLATHCTAEEWHPREDAWDMLHLIIRLGLLVSVDVGAGTASAIIGNEYKVDHIVMAESISDHASGEDALMVAVTRAAAEIGRCKMLEAAS